MAKQPNPPKFSGDPRFKRDVQPDYRPVFKGFSDVKSQIKPSMREAMQRRLKKRG